MLLVLNSNEGGSQRVVSVNANLAIYLLAIRDLWTPDRDDA